MSELLDDASDLWGRPPAKKKRCLGCGQSAEPYDGRWCWRCCHDGQRARIERLMSPEALRKAVRRLAPGESHDGPA